MEQNVERPGKGHNRGLGLRPPWGGAGSLEDVLSAVFLFSELAGRALLAREPSRARTDLEDLQAVVLRGVRLLRDTSSSMPGPAPGPGPVDLNRTLERVTRSVRPTLSEKTRLRVAFGAPPIVRADASVVELSLLALLLHCEGAASVPRLLEVGTDTAPLLHTRGGRSPGDPVQGGQLIIRSGLRKAFPGLRSPGQPHPASLHPRGGLSEGAVKSVLRIGTLLRRSLGHLEVRLESTDKTELRLLFFPETLSNVNLQAPLPGVRQQDGRPGEDGAQVTDSSHPGRNP